MRAAGLAGQADAEPAFQCINEFHGPFKSSPLTINWAQSYGGRNAPASRGGAFAAIARPLTPPDRR
jgi:hypothetical protein